MATSGEDMHHEGKAPMAEIDFMRLAGISPELAEFVAEVIERPEILLSMPSEKRCEIEAQMDAVLELFGPESTLRNDTLNPDAHNSLKGD